MAKKQNKNFNWVDYSILGIVILLVAASAYSMYKPEKHTTREREITITVNNAPDYIIESISTGPVQSPYVTEVIEKWTEPAKMVVTTNDGRVITTTHPYNKNLFLRLRMNLIEDGGEIFYQNRQVLLGKNIGMVVGNTSVSGKIINIG